MTPRDTKYQPGVCTALLVAALMLLAVAVMVTGCTRTTYVPVESVRTEYVGADTTALMRLVGYLREQVRSKDRAIDSLMQSYSERLILNDKGDTLRHDRERIVYRSSYRQKELEKLLESKNDSIHYLREKLESIKADSIPIPYPLEKPLTRWERAKMDFGGFALGGVAVVVSAIVVWLIRRFRK